MTLADLGAALGERSLLTVDDLKEAMRNGAHLLTTPRSAIFVSVNDYEAARERAALVGPAVGNLAEILDALPHLEEWARGEGCTQAHVIAGRKGWARVLKAHGYEEYSTTMRKFL